MILTLLSYSGPGATSSTFSFGLLSSHFTMLSSLWSNPERERERSLWIYVLCTFPSCRLLSLPLFDLSRGKIIRRETQDDSLCIAVGTQSRHNRILPTSNFMWVCNYTYYLAKAYRTYWLSVIFTCLAWIIHTTGGLCGMHERFQGIIWIVFICCWASRTFHFNSWHTVMQQAQVLKYPCDIHEVFHMKIVFPPGGSERKESDAENKTLHKNEKESR